MFLTLGLFTFRCFRLKVTLDVLGLDVLGLDVLVLDVLGEHGNLTRCMIEFKCKDTRIWVLD